MSDTTDSWEPLSANLVHQAVVCPIQKSRMESHVQHLGVFDERGDLIESSIEDRHHGTHLYQAADLSIYSEIDTAPEDEAIYAGVFFNHFGHFLLESLARLWYARSRPDLPIVWVGVDSWASPPALKSWQREILDVLGLENRVRVATRAERFRVLHVPDAGYKYADWCQPDHAAFLASFDGVRQIAGRRIWLSRSDVGNGVGTMNGSMIEENVRKSGWHPIRPEKLTVREQLQTLAEAEEIAGEEGSAFHLLLLLKDLDGKKFTSSGVTASSTCRSTRLETLEESSSISIRPTPMPCFPLPEEKCKGSRQTRARFSTACERRSIRLRSRMSMGITPCGG